LPKEKIESLRTLHTFASPTACPDPSGSQRSKPKLAKELQFCIRTRAKLLFLSFKLNELEIKIWQLRNQNYTARFGQVVTN